MFVREPIERLVSAFQRLFTTVEVSQELYDEYTRPILNRIRYNGTNMMPINANAAWKMDLKMTFSEFVRGLLKIKGVQGFLENGFFAPQVNSCGVCRLNYTFIGSVRTFSEDITYL